MLYNIQHSSNINDNYNTECITTLTDYNSHNRDKLKSHSDGNQHGCTELYTKFIS